MEWAAFERVEGPILIHQRVDAIGAQMAWVIAASNGVKINGRRPKLADFLMDWDRTPASEAAAAAALGAVLEAAAQKGGT